MSINDEFELVPRGALKDLKREIDLLKQNQSQSKTGEAEDLSKSIALMRKSIDAMYDLFKKAAEEIKLEDRDQNLIEKKLEPLTSKIEVLSEQNQKIAKALVTISNMVQENMKKVEEVQKKAEEENKQSMPELPRFSASQPTPPSMSSSQMPSQLSQPPQMQSSPMSQSQNSGLSAEPLPRLGSMGGMGSPSMGSSMQGGMSMPPPPPKKKGFF
ncbi:MAG: hypothetical protein WC755_00295 [Candidatus Woesearchaeota archaeon]